MKVKLLNNQIELILKSLQEYSKVEKDKKQLIYVTYESLLTQLLQAKESRDEKSLKKDKKVIDNQKVI